MLQILKNNHKYKQTLGYRVLHLFRTPYLILIGYARVSTLDQNLLLQYKTLHETRCDKIYEVKAGLTGRPVVRVGCPAENDTLAVA